MKIFRKECPLCGDEYIYYDVRNVPQHCGSLKCKTNWNYQQHNVDQWGNRPTPEEIQGWTSSEKSTDSSEKQN